MTVAFLARPLPALAAAPSARQVTSLQALRRGERAQVRVEEVALIEPPELGERLMEMGLVAGTEVEVLQPVRWGGALRLSVRGYVLSLRAGDAQRVEVTKLR